jgi:Flp pilus assembly protein TadG
MFDSELRCKHYDMSTCRTVCWPSFLRDARGSTAMLFTLALPLLLTAGAAAVEYGHISMRRAQMQKAADAAAIMAAQELALANVTIDRVSAVARQMVAANIGPYEDISVEMMVPQDRNSVRIALVGQVRSMTSKILTLPTSDIRTGATARLSEKHKLCLLTLDPNSPGTLSLNKRAQITANDCAIYSNSTHSSGLEGMKGTQGRASLICSAGGARIDDRTDFLPDPQIDCPTNPDPLQNQASPSVGPCIDSKRRIKGGTWTLSPGTYCDGLTIEKGAVVTFNPGIYVIKDGMFAVTDDSTLKGVNVGLYFIGDKAGLLFDADTTISLTAPKTGIMAGLLMFEERSLGLPDPPPHAQARPDVPADRSNGRSRPYRIVSNNARTLLGTIYLPRGRLIIDADRPVGDMSAYTVIVAHRLELYEGPHLVLNSDYDATDIPVPRGVGPRRGPSLQN